MSFLDRVGNKVDNIRSKQSENSDINSIKKEIQSEKDAIDIAITKLGEYYWNQYAQGNMDAPEEIAAVFEEIEQRVVRVGELNENIDKRKVEGIEQRIEIDKATKEKEEMKAAEAAERKRQREEAKRIAAEEKAAEEMTSDPDDGQ